MTVSTDDSSATPLHLFGDLLDLQPRPRPISRRLPPHTMVGIDGSSIIGTSSIDPPNPHSTFTACGWS